MRIKEDKDSIDLKLWHKLLLYVVWLPGVRRVIKDLIVKDDYILQQQQANYYLVCGFLVFVFALIIDHSVGQWFWVMWGLGFLASYLFDITYNKERQKVSIMKRDKRRPPWDNLDF